MSPAAEISVEMALRGYQGKGNGSFAEDSVMLPLMGDFIHDIFFLRKYLIPYTMADNKG